MAGGPWRWIGDLALLGVVLALLLAWPLRAPPIGEHGEAREGLVVRDIVCHGRWLLPLREGALPSKPPLFHWIAAIAARAAGCSDATLRLPSALAAWVMASATFVLGATIGGRATGWLAAGALLGTEMFWSAATEARVDMVFAACVTASLAGFFLWRAAVTRGAPPARGVRAACYLGAAAAVLAKGPAGLLLPGLVIAAVLAWQREWALARRLWSWPLAAAVLLIDAGWYGLAIRAGGRDFVAVQLLYENVDRFLGRGSFAHAAEHPGFRHFRLRMPLEFARHFLPWNLVLGAAAVRAARGGREDATGRGLHAWWLVILAFFTLAVGQRTVYLLPLAPAVALLAARALAAATTPPVPRWRSARALAAAIVVFDLAVAGATQAVRLEHARLGSLAPFAATVAQLVPADAPLYVAPDLEPPDVLTLEYRLDRRLERRRAACVGRGYVLVREERAALLAPEDFERIATTARGRDPLVLVRSLRDATCPPER